jgi:hypothetical protein
MSRRSSIALLLASIALAACGGGNDDGDRGGGEPAPSPRQDVVLTLDRETPHAGDTIELTVENHTSTRLEYGLVYRLERRVDAGWRWINKDAAFALILKVVEAGKREREEIGLEDDLRAGGYRIVKEFSAPATGREYRATVEFTVAERW